MGTDDDLRIALRMLLCPLGLTVVSGQRRASGAQQSLTARRFGVRMRGAPGDFERGAAKQAVDVTPNSASESGGVQPASRRIGTAHGANGGVLITWSAALASKAIVAGR